MTDRPSLPTDAELEILRVLWDRGASTVREVLDVLADERTYTTVLKLLQIMHEKGIVARDESARSHVYRAVAEREPTQRALLRDLTDRAFAGSAGKLVLRALSSRRATEEELAEVRRLLDELEADR